MGSSLGPTKSRQARFLPIADAVAEAFARLAERAEFTGGGDYVFCSRLGPPLDRAALRRRFKAAAAAPRLRVLRFHAPTSLGRRAPHPPG